MMKRSFFLLVAVVMGGNVLFAQSVDEGKKFLYYHRYKSAKEAFEKVLAANPNNIDAVYWLGQTLLDKSQDNTVFDSVAAKNLYQKALQQNGNAPLLLAGMGQVELTEGKTNDARQRFETAITLTKGKEVDVLNAVGRANVEAKAGDANYAIEKLNLATQVKKFNDAETYMLMGDAYRKLIDGGNAVTSYNKALGIDPKLAAAKYSIARVYLTQNNPDYFLPAFEEAVQLDPAYAPAYYELFYYYYRRDVNKASGYLDKYIANADQGPEMEYLKTDFTWAKGDNAGAKAAAQKLITQYGDKVSPRMYRMVAYTSDTLGDLAGAKQAMNTFFQKAKPEEVLPADYIELAKIDSKTPGNEQSAFENFKKAIALDTVAENKVKYTQQAADLAKKLGNRTEQANWLGVAYSLEKNPNQNDLYNWGYAHYQAGNYTTSDSIFALYEQKYPTEIFGPLWRAKSNQAMDTTMEKGLAVTHYQNFVKVAKAADSVKYKPQIVSALFYLASYSNDIKKDKDAAIDYLTQVTQIDPANEQAPKFIQILSKPAKSSTPATKPKTSGNAAGGGSSKSSGGK